LNDAYRPVPPSEHGDTRPLTQNSSASARLKAWYDDKTAMLFHWLCKMGIQTISKVVVVQRFFSNQQ